MTKSPSTISISNIINQISSLQSTVFVASIPKFRCFNPLQLSPLSKKLHPHFPDDFSIKHHKASAFPAFFRNIFSMKHQKHAIFSGEFSHLFGTKNGMILPGQRGGGSGHQTGQWLTRSPGAVAKMVGSSGVEVGRSYFV